MVSMQMRFPSWCDDVTGVRSAPYANDDSPNDSDELLTDVGSRDANYQSGLLSALDMLLPAFDHDQCFWDLKFNTDLNVDLNSDQAAHARTAALGYDTSDETCFAISSLAQSLSAVSNATQSLPSEGDHAMPRQSYRTPMRPRRLSESAASVASSDYGEYGSEKDVVIVRPGRHRSISLGSSSGPARGSRTTPYHLPNMAPAEGESSRPRSKTVTEIPSSGEAVIITAEKQQRSSKAPGRSCACCNCSNTPMWRDGRHGMRLCNACGIRWQKYGLCCITCSYVPRKNERGNICKRCKTELPMPELTKRRVSMSLSTNSAAASKDLADIYADEDSPESPNKESDDEP